jgi:hypothetical protein
MYGGSDRNEAKMQKKFWVNQDLEKKLCQYDRGIVRKYNNLSDHLKGEYNNVNLWREASCKLHICTVYSLVSAARGEERSRSRTY